ncbi:ead/Ea22-like family protein [Salmonella enterica]|uniref:Ead/Ea22-like family protein n=1 Tax=Salmonella enterica subsp. enterica serovar Saintpaul TaxID=90105 RepID=A0A5U9IBI9_SALET|nr:ead/Ea22-like family protein [Salmonella enterica]EBS2302362.1 ead/Ea22-like family protein [Salmonella enterica subsp. enterica serovar Saintpaul]EDW0015899.1 ead/Ea22-like family protein [Salmonella enterica subsp. enterica serovar Aba]HCZ4729931.1 ead/Ea22-like family protein [Salmonella enterica subsp. enterica serovar Saintpaul str. CFSAN004137]EBA1055656.1 ead/Ea22-like family protein [Salmonella enterica]
MTIDKQALRQKAVKAGGEEWQSRKMLGPAGEYTVIVKGSLEKHPGWTTCRPVADEVIDKKTMDFIAAANPATMLALLDENLQLQREKDAIEAVALALRDDMRQAREQLEAAEHTAAVDHEAACSLVEENEELKRRIAELEARAVNLPKRSVGEVMHLSGFSRDYAEGWCAGNDNAMHEIRAAGIKVKGE